MYKTSGTKHMWRKNVQMEMRKKDRVRYLITTEDG